MSKIIKWMLIGLVVLAIVFTAGIAIGMFTTLVGYDMETKVPIQALVCAIQPEVWEILSAFVGFVSILFYPLFFIGLFIVVIKILGVIAGQDAIIKGITVKRLVKAVVCLLALAIVFTTAIMIFLVIASPGEAMQTIVGATFGVFFMVALILSDVLVFIVGPFVIAIKILVAIVDGPLKQLKTKEEKDASMGKLDR